jgi:hypothetical protein
MSCACGEQHRRIFPATIKYEVYVDAGRQTVPVKWTQEDLCVCTACGEASALVPWRELLELKAGGGESAA